METFAVEADVQGGPGAARRARRFVRSELRGRVSARQLQDVTLLVTELVANGVRHGGADAADEIRLRLESRPPALRVEVVDPGRRRAGVAPRRPDVNGGGGGLGLQIVDRVASRWGVRDGAATTVWFELDLG